MAATLDTISAFLKLIVNIDGQRTADFGNAEQSFTRTPSLSIETIGTGAGAANQIWSDARSLAASTAETLDLSGSLTNALGQTVTFAKIRWLIIVNRGNSTTEAIPTSVSSVLQVGGASSNACSTFFVSSTDKVKVYPGFHVWATNDATAYAVTAGTGDQLKIENTDSGNSVNYDIIIVGSE